MILSIVLHAKSVLMDIWDPIVAAQRIQDERCTYTLASTPFVSDLTYNEGVGRYDISTMRLFLTAGAPIPRVLVQDAKRKRDIFVMSAWGMSENGVVTATRIGDSEDKIVNTDGAPLPGQQVRVVDVDGKPLPPGEEGRLQARCCTQFVGYLGRPEAYEMHDGMWFETGDNARMDADGYIRIVSRSKDIIIRGGENIPVVEVEELLYRHAAVQDAAIVAMPDERLGERGCAFVVLRAGHTLTLQDMLSYLSEQRLARTYMPERLEIVTELPRTPSGKIQKFKLREAAQGFGKA
jgi:cyclohexanecarboxylate-CoA ligase